MQEITEIELLHRTAAMDVSNCPHCSWRYTSNDKYEGKPAPRDEQGLRPFSGKVGHK